MAEENFLTFLGTAGARFVMIKQLRHSGGIWVNCRGTNVLIDPGPGSLVRCHNHQPLLNPEILDGVILTHRHIDHANDVNVIIEAMSEGGHKKRGAVFAPRDAYAPDPVIFEYVRRYPQRIEQLEPLQSYAVGNFSFQTSMAHVHPAQTYGLKFSLNQTSIGLLTDTRFFPELSQFYKTDVLIVCAIFVHPRPGVDHLSIDELTPLLKELRPRKTILTHFGMTMLQAVPENVASELAQAVGSEVIAATDGLTLGF